MKKSFVLALSLLAAIPALAVIDSGLTNSPFIPPSLSQTDTNDAVLVQGTLRGKTVNGAIPYASLVGQLQALITGSTNVYDLQGAAQAATNGITAAIVSQVLTTGFSTNTIYYFDPLATNTFSQPNDPRSPYHHLDDVNTVLLTPPVTFSLVNGIYPFANPISNVTTFVGQSVANTVLWDCNNNRGGVAGNQEWLASCFVWLTNNCDYENFTVGFSNSGAMYPNNPGVYNGIWYVPAGTMGSGDVIKNVNVPFNLPDGLQGGSPVFGWFAFHYGSSTNPLTLTCQNFNGEFLRGAIYDYGGGVSVRGFNLQNCQFISDGSTNVASDGYSYGLRMFQMQSGSFANINNCSFTTTNGNRGEPFNVTATGTATNVIVNVVGTTMRTTTNDYDISGTSLSTGPNGVVMNVAACNLDTNAFSLSAYWTANLSASWQDTLLNENHVGNSAVFSGNVAAVGYSGNGSGLTGVNAATAVSATSATSATTATTAVNASGTGNAMQTNNAGPVSLTNAQNTVVGTFSGNGGGLTGLNTAMSGSALYAGQCFVDAINGSDANNGTIAFPFQTLTNAALTGLNIVVLRGPIYNQTFTNTGQNVYLASGVIWSNSAAPFETIANVSGNTVTIGGYNSPGGVLINAQSSTTGCFNIYNTTNVTLNVQAQMFTNTAPLVYQLINGTNWGDSISVNAPSGVQFSSICNNTGSFPYFYSLGVYLTSQGSSRSSIQLIQIGGNSTQFPQTSFPYTNNVFEFNSPNVIFTSAVAVRYSDNERVILDPGTFSFPVTSLTTTSTNWACIFRDTTLTNAWPGPAGSITNGLSIVGPPGANP